MTVVQCLSDRLLSGSISKRMLASGFQMVRPLGEGTYGTVWLAVEENTGVHVAIKFFAHGTGQQWQMLQDEVRQLAVLDDANGIVHLKDVVADADPPYYVMSYAEGGSLAQRIEKGPLSLPEALRIFREVVQALAYVHAHGVRHCDLKPGNILLDALGRPVVADFGQAHLSNDATPALGTFFYMAPEQADLGHKIPDTRWDVYGLGALFYAMLTGEPPRKDSALSGELSGTVELDHRLRRYRQGVASTPAPTAHRRLPGMDKQLAGIIDGCLELDPKKRIPSAEGILGALEKRRVRRQQRPLLIYGIAAPLAVILLMALAALGMFNPMIKDSKKILQDQVLDGDQVMADLLGTGMKMSLENRIKSLRDLLKKDRGEKLRGLLAQSTSLRRAGAKLDDVRIQLNSWLEDASQDSNINRSFSGLLAAGADGYIIDNGVWDNASQPPISWRHTQKQEALWAEDKSWRDWFNGGGNLTSGQHYPPVNSPHISQPFVSKEKDRDGNERGVVICVTVPVKDEDGKVLGVLTGSVTWKEFGRWNEDVTIANGKVVVFNQRGEALKHRSQGRDEAEHDDVLEAIKQAGEGNPPAYADNLAAQLKPEQSEKGVCANFEDPFQGNKGGTQLAGYRFFNPNKEESDSLGSLGANWGVIVEHNKDKVLAPVEGLSHFMVRGGFWMLVAAGALTGAVWVGLIWLLRREERLGHG
jgi:eukaryotic-like serine/threonine-protein kinase